MTHCNVCHAWKPTQWNGHAWVDKEAICAYDASMKVCTDTCERGSIVGPRTPALYGTGGNNAGTVDKTRASVRSVADNSVSISDSIYTDLDSDNADTEYLFTHQRDDYEYFKDKHAIALFAEMGCISGQATVKYTRDVKKKAQAVTLAYLYKKFHRESGPMWIRGNVDGTLGFIEIEDIIDKGYKECVQLNAGSHTLILTSDHEVLTPDGYKPVSALEPPALVMVNGAYYYECPECGWGFTLQKPTHSVKYPHWCHSCRAKAVNYNKKGDTEYVDREGYVQLTGPQVKGGRFRP
jgi:hypothetical protein